MNKIVLLAIGLFILFGVVSAYQVNISAPDTLTIGLPLVVKGTTTFGIGTPIDVVLYQQVTTSTEVQRIIAYVQSDNTFRVVFDTTYLPKGTYKVEVPAIGTGDSVNMRQVKLIDRSDDISLTSQSIQALSGRILISGKVSGDPSSGIQVTVIGPDNGIIYGPQYVATDSVGGFDITVPVSQPGDYEVTFTDARGYIGARIITVIGAQETVTPATSATVTNVLSAHTKTSRDRPAYFIIRPLNSGPITVSTSSSVDWVIEYTDSDGNLHTINDQGDLNSEEIVITGADQPLFFKIYPYKYSVSAIVTLTAENVESVEVSPDVPEIFRPIPSDSGGAPLSQGYTGAATPTQESPVHAYLGIAAVCLGMLGVYCRRKGSV